MLNEQVEINLNQSIGESQISVSENENDASIQHQNSIRVYKIQNT